MKALILIVLIVLSSNFNTVYGQPLGTEPGNKAPEISLPAINGDTIALSSFAGKMVLVDFWATWCSPCLREQPELAELYKKYKQAEFTNAKGFEIYGVSMDSKKNTWEDYVTKHGIDWIQVGDLKFWNSPTAKVYNIQELPFNVLIDGRGIIIAKNLHGEELDKELAKYLSVKSE
jgi:thiol-disulfide isomerase/thioredoxin